MSDLYTAVAACAGATETNEHGAFCGEFTFPEGFIGFAGHFPGMPVLPGIVQIMAVLHTCASCGLPVRITDIKSCKFVHPVLPEQTMCVTATLSDNGQRKTLQALTRLGEAVCAEMVIFTESTCSEAAV